MQLKAWEEYTSKLEEKYVALMTEHESFQRELAAVRGILDDGTDPDIHGTAPTHPPLPAQLLPLVTQTFDTASIDMACTLTFTLSLAPGTSSASAHHMSAVPADTIVGCQPGCLYRL